MTYEAAVFSTFLAYRRFKNARSMLQPSNVTFYISEHRNFEWLTGMAAVAANKCTSWWKFSTSLSMATHQSSPPLGQHVDLVSLSMATPKWLASTIMVVVVRMALALASWRNTNTRMNTPKKECNKTWAKELYTVRTPRIVSENAYLMRCDRDGHGDAWMKSENVACCALCAFIPFMGHTTQWYNSPFIDKVVCSLYRYKMRFVQYQDEACARVARSPTRPRLRRTRGVTA